MQDDQLTEVHANPIPRPPFEDNACGQCEGTGTTQSASNGEDEQCPVCDGTGVLDQDDEA